MARFYDAASRKDALAQLAREIPRAQAFYAERSRRPVLGAESPVGYVVWWRRWDGSTWSPVMVFALDRRGAVLWSIPGVDDSVIQDVFRSAQRQTQESPESGKLERVDEAIASLLGMEIAVALQRVHPEMGALEDIPLPPDIPRPEMWNLESVERAVRDGFTFLIPFHIGESFYSQNAYWIGGVQAAAMGLTVGPEHTPELGLLPDGWMWIHTFFPTEMVSQEASRRAWVGAPNENGVVKVRLEIDPETVDWNTLNRGHQIRAPRGLI